MADERQEVTMAEPSALLSELSRSGREILSTILSILQNRLELIGLELQEEKYRIVSLLIWSALAILFLLLAIVLGTFALLFVLEGTARVVGLFAFTLLYGLGAIVSLVVIMRMIRRGLPFSRTVAELKKDRECL
jgi:uncharacterized membrane protein YqjE